MAGPVSDAVEVIIYSREGCHLCDIAAGVIDEAARAQRLAIDVKVIDIDGDPNLRELYDQEVPVVFVGGKKAFKYRVDPDRFVELVRRRA